MAKKVLIISSSPRKGGNSDLLCDEFMKGALEAGNEVEKIVLKDKTVHPCTGCSVCSMYGKPCPQKDDAAEIVEKMIAADVIVMATPVYFYTMCGQMKIMIDRCCARYTEITNKEFYFIIAAAEDNKAMMERTIDEMGLFLTAHAGEDGGADNIWDALLKLDVQRIDHGCRAAEHPELMEYLQEHQILCAMCPSGNVYSGAAASFEAHPLLTLLHSGVPVSISSDDPPYTCSMTEELILDAEKMGLTEAELIQIIRNGFAYSISGQHLLPQFDAWVERFQQEGAQ